MVLSRSAVYPLSHGLQALKLQHTHELLSPNDGTALCGSSRQTATGMPQTFCQENGTAWSASFHEAARTRVGGTRLLSA